MNISELRRAYHQRISEEIIRIQKDGESEYPNFADRGSKASRAIAQGIVHRLGGISSHKGLSGQTAGGLFETLTRGFLEQTFALLQHLRPGKWQYSVQMPISHFDQYEHLANLERIVEQYNELASSLGMDYIIKPDIVIGRWPLSDDEINQDQILVTQGGPFASLRLSGRQISMRRGSFYLPASVVSGRSGATGARTPEPRPSI